MSQTTPSFWKIDTDISTETKNPIAILNTHAKSLRDMTQGKLTAHVQPIQENNNRMTVRFQIVAPHLGYRYELLRISYDAAQIFPSIIKQGNDEIQANSLAEFQTQIQKIISAEATSKLLNSLYQQSISVLGESI